MKYLKKFFEDFTLYDEPVVDIFPDTVSIYTSDGSFLLRRGDTTREADIIRVSYYQNTAKDGNIIKDGEPDFLVFDLHFVKNEKGIKTLVNITYGDQMKSEFSIEKPNVIDLGHYNGIRSIADTDTHFGFEDTTIRNLCKLFNGLDFGYNLSPKDFKFIDKYPDTYNYSQAPKIQIKDQLKTENKAGSEIILVVNNSKPPHDYFLKNIVNYLNIREVSYEIASSSEEIVELSKKFKVKGAISTGSDYRISKSDYESKLSKFAYDHLTCPVIGICFGIQSMAQHYGGTIKDSGDYFHKHEKLEQVNNDSILFKGVDYENMEFSFSFHDIIDKMPEGFKSTSFVDGFITSIEDETKLRWGVLFHPEDKPHTYPVLDKFIEFCGLSKEPQQELLKQGKFEHLKSFGKF
jgi:anthranilate/para-aminobenzoate synthase component II